MPYNYIYKYPEIKALLEANNCPVTEQYVKDMQFAKFMVRPSLITIPYKCYPGASIIINLPKLRMPPIRPMRYLFLCFDGKVDAKITLKINGEPTLFMPLPLTDCIMYADMSPCNPDYATSDFINKSEVNDKLHEMDICQSVVNMHRVNSMVIEVNGRLPKLLHLLGWVYHMQYDIPGVNPKRYDCFAT